jgi:hypothetical protein
MFSSSTIARAINRNSCFSISVICFSTYGSVYQVVELPDLSLYILWHCTTHKNPDLLMVSLP